MKKVFILLFAALSMVCSAQDFSYLESLKLDNAAACKSVEPTVLKCADYLFSTPIADDLNALQAAQFVLEWMGEPPDYSFAIKGDLLKSISSDINLSSRFLAAMAEAAVKNGMDDKAAYEVAYTTRFLAYCENQDNKVKLNSTIKRYLKAKKEGKLAGLIK